MTFLVANWLVFIILGVYFLPMFFLFISCAFIINIIYLKKIKNIFFWNINLKRKDEALKINFGGTLFEINKNTLFEDIKKIGSYKDLSSKHEDYWVYQKYESEPLLSFIWTYYIEKKIDKETLINIKNYYEEKKLLEKTLEEEIFDIDMHSFSYMRSDYSILLERFFIEEMKKENLISDLKMDYLFSLISFDFFIGNKKSDSQKYTYMSYAKDDRARNIEYFFDNLKSLDLKTKTLLDFKKNYNTDIQNLTKDLYDIKIDNYEQIKKIFDLDLYYDEIKDLALTKDNKECGKVSDYILSPKDFYLFLIQVKKINIKNKDFIFDNYLFEPKITKSLYIKQQKEFEKDYFILNIGKTNKHIALSES